MEKKLPYEAPAAELVSFDNDVVVASTTKVCEYHTGWHDVVTGPFDVCNTDFGSYTDDLIL